MSRRSRKCHDVATGLPGGLSAESFIDTGGGDCMIRVNEKGTHVVEIQNRTLLRFRIGLSSECESAHLHYASQEKTWMETFEISPRPHSGGARERTLRNEIACAEAAGDRSVMVTISYQVIGCMGAGSATVQLQIDTDR
jgi:hypothetical protein